MALEVIKACLGILLLMLGWVVVQATIRRRMGYPPDRDVLDDMAHGCGSCGHACEPARQDQWTHELTVTGRSS